MAFLCFSRSSINSAIAGLYSCFISHGNIISPFASGTGISRGLPKGFIFQWFYLSIGYCASRLHPQQHIFHFIDQFDVGMYSAFITEVDNILIAFLLLLCQAGQTFHFSNPAGPPLLLTARDDLCGSMIQESFWISTVIRLGLSNKKIRKS